MGRERHYSSIILERLMQFANKQRWTELITFLNGLSNSDFRTANYMIGEIIMPQMTQTDFWTLFDQLARYNSKAFVQTMLKAAAPMIHDNRLTLESEILDDLFQYWNQNDKFIDKHKFIMSILPVLNNPDDLTNLFNRLEITDTRLQLNYLVEFDNLPCQFLIFNNLKLLAHEPEVLRHYCVLLIKHGGDASFNLACLLKAYFDIKDVPGNFSLSIEPHELSYIDRSFETFSKVMRRV
jgi:hypothetical protein